MKKQKKAWSSRGKPLLRLGVFGGTFNPIHFGHLRAAEEVREKLRLDRILFIPSGTPPLKTSDIADAGDRYTMVAAAVKGNPNFEVSDIETSKPAKSYSVETVAELKARHDNAELVFIMGIDAFTDIPNWRYPEKLVSMIDFAVISRPDRSFASLALSPYVEAPEKHIPKALSMTDSPVYVNLRGGRKAALVNVTPLAISSTEIRKRISSGLSIKYLLPQNIESFIISNRLYFPAEKRPLSKQQKGRVET